jgi:hypothetical protein
VPYRPYVHILPIRLIFTAKAYSHRSKPSNSRDCSQFALRLHGATHLSLADRRTLCKLWTPGLEQAFPNAVSICQSSKLTGRPHPSRKVSTTNLLRTFNTHVQVDFFYIEDLDPSPILHIRDTASGLSACCVQVSRDTDLTGCNFQKHWVYIHGPPSECSGDPEFDNSTCRQYLSHHNVTYKARPARRHNKTGLSNLDTRLSNCLQGDSPLIYAKVCHRFPAASHFLRSLNTLYSSELFCKEVVPLDPLRKHVVISLL